MIEKSVTSPQTAAIGLTGIVCMLYALNGPLYRWQDLITFAVVGAGGVLIIGGKIFKGRKSVIWPAESVQPGEKNAVRGIS